MMSLSYTGARQYDLGITAAERALAFDPNSAPGYATMSLALAYSGKPAEGVVAAQKAMRLDPGNRDLYSLDEGVAYTLMGRYDEAVPALKTYLGRYSNFNVAHLYLMPVMLSWDGMKRHERRLQK
jgi:tetratricopeptide (TPR) repeat protein